MLHLCFFADYPCVKILLLIRTTVITKALLHSVNISNRTVQRRTTWLFSRDICPSLSCSTSTNADWRRLQPTSITRASTTTLLLLLLIGLRLLVPLAQSPPVTPCLWHRWGRGHAHRLSITVTSFRVRETVRWSRKLWSNLDLIILLHRSPVR